MELTKQLEMLKELCALDGVSGCEERVAARPSAAGLSGPAGCSGQPHLREKGQTDPKK